MATYFDFYIRQVLEELETKGRLKMKAAEARELIHVTSSRETYRNKGKNYTGTVYHLRIDGRKGAMTIHNRTHKYIKVDGHSNPKKDLREAAMSCIWHEPVLCHVEPGIPVYF